MREIDALDGLINKNCGRFGIQFRVNEQRKSGRGVRAQMDRELYKNISRMVGELPNVTVVDGSDGLLIEEEEEERKEIINSEGRILI